MQTGTVIGARQLTVLAILWQACIPQSFPTYSGSRSTITRTPSLLLLLVPAPSLFSDCPSTQLYSEHPTYTESGPETYTAPCMSHMQCTQKNKKEESFLWQ